MGSTVALRGAQKRYGATVVLDGLDLTVPTGCIYGFLGRNGAGKTTTLRALMGLHELDAGSLSLFGAEVGRPGVPEKRRIGYVSQEQHLYDWMTARELGRFVGGLYPTWEPSRFDELLQRFDVPVDRRVEHLSGGTRVKLALCLALSPSPDLLILDEPTAGLDPVARRELLDLVRAQADTDGRTTIFSGHVVSEIERVADVIGVLDGGRLHFEGSPETLMAQTRNLMGALPSLPAGVSVLATRTERSEAVHTLRSSVGWEGIEAELAPLPLEEAFLALTLYRNPS